jgi:ribonuclease-3
MTEAPSEPLHELERRLGYRFNRLELLRSALTHSSWRRTHGGGGDNERLEFLGDAVLELRVSELLLAAHPECDEGQLTRWRSWLVSARHLARLGQALDLGAGLRLSPAEDAIGGRAKPRLLANALEAVIAAIHLDGGYAAAAAFIDRLMELPLRQLGPETLHEFGFKSALQEWAHAQGAELPVYSLVEQSGPEHGKRFTVQVHVGTRDPHRGSGKTKKEAEQQAAAAALRAFGQLPGRNLP